MTSYIKTTVLLLFLLCVTKLIQAENVKSAAKLEISNKTEAVKQKINVSEGSTLKGVEKKPEKVEKTTGNSIKEKEEKKQSEIKKTEEKKPSGIKTTEKKPSEVKTTQGKKPSGVKATEAKKPSGVKPTEEKKPSGTKTTEEKKPSGIKAKETKKPSEIKTTQEKKRSGAKTAPVKKPSGAKTAPVKKPNGAKTAPVKKPSGAKTAPVKKPIGTKTAPAKKPIGTKTAPAKKPIGTKIVLEKKPSGTQTAPAKKPIGTKTAPEKKPNETKTAPEKKPSGVKATQDKKRNLPLRRIRRSGFFPFPGDTIDEDYNIIVMESDVFDFPFSNTFSGLSLPNIPLGLRGGYEQKKDDRKRFFFLIGRLIAKAFSWLINRSDDSTNTKQATDFFQKLTNLLDTYSGALGIPPHAQEEIKELLKRYTGDFTKTSTSSSTNAPPSNETKPTQTSVSKRNGDKKRFLGTIWRWIKKAWNWLTQLRSEDTIKPNTNRATNFFTKLMTLFDKYGQGLGIPPNLLEEIRSLVKRYGKDSSKTPTNEPKSNATNSTATNSTATNSTAKNSSATNSTATNSTATNSTAKNSSATNSTATNSSATNSTATKSSVANSTATKSSATNSTATKSSATNSTATKSTTTNSNATNANATNANTTKPNVTKSNSTLRAEIIPKTDDKRRFLGTIWRWIKKAFAWLFGRGEDASSANTKRAAEFFNKLMGLFETYSVALGIPPHVQTEIMKLLKKFESNHTNAISSKKPVVTPEPNKKNSTLRAEKVQKPLVSSNPALAKNSEGEGPSLEKVLQRYCELSAGSSNIITTLKALVREFDVDGKSGSGRRADTDFKKFIEALWMIYKNAGTGKRSGYDVNFIKEVINKYCEGFKRNKTDSTSTSKRAHARESVRPRVRTKPNLMHLISEEEPNVRSEYDDLIGWRQGVFEPNKDQKVSKKQTGKSSPRIIKKSKIRRLKKPKNFKNRLINLYNGKENGTGTRGHTGQFSKPKIIGYNENSTLFEVKTGVERDEGSKDSNPRLRCNVRTKGSMSNADGRTGSSKGHTFSEVPSNDTKTLLCSSETSEVHRPSKNAYIKQSVSGKSVVSYDSPDKYIGHNNSPSKDNLEIGTSGFSTLNDTSSKNRSISVVSTDSQNADSVSRSETKFVHGNGNQKGMESSANVEGSIDAVPNKNPFIMNSRQHSLGMVVENPDRNMESPLPVENNEKIQTYSKFERTEDFDINFRRLDSVRPDFHHGPRPR